MIEKLRLGMLLSGGGTTACKVIEACRNGRLKRIEPVLVISSDPHAKGIQRMIERGMETKDVCVHPPKMHAEAEGYGATLLHACKVRDVDLIGQYGWMPKTPANLVAAYQKRMINQHPGPLDPGHPDFGGKGMYGRRVHAARLLFVRKTKRDHWTEVVAQYVDPEFDKGAVIGARRVPIMADDEVETLRERALIEEYETQIQALEDFSNGCVREVHRDTPLVLASNYLLLEECKATARLLYPHG